MRGWRTLSKNTENRIKELEAEVGIGGKIYLMTLETYIPRYSPNHPYKEVRFLMVDDGNGKERFIRKLAPGEFLPDVEGGMKPWAKMGDPKEEAAPK
jgi:hypothetical protein